MRTPCITPTLLALAAGLSLQAGDLRWEAGAALVTGTNDLAKVTSNTTGGTLEAGFSLPVTSENRARVALALMHVPGNYRDNLKSSLTGLQLRAETTYPLWGERLGGFFGVTVNRWRVKNVGTEVMELRAVGTNMRPYPVQAFALKDPEGLKLGLRAGLDLRFSRHLTAFAAFQMAEAGGAKYVAPVKNASNQWVGGYTNHGPVNPSWLEWGARWTF